MSPAVGFDTKELTRKPEIETAELGLGFFTSLGAGVEVFDLDRFKERYDQAVSATYKKMGLERLCTIINLVLVQIPFLHNN